MSAYVIVEFTVTDPDLYRDKYAGNAGKTAKEYGAEVLANSKWELLDGGTGLSSGVIVQFPDHETVLRWYNSPEYQKILPMRLANSTGRAFIVEGAS